MARQAVRGTNAPGGRAVAAPCAYYRVWGAPRLPSRDVLLGRVGAPLPVKAMRERRRARSVTAVLRR
ncbi:MAG TPA: hypothetical protein VFV33_03340, partial [Gemmatimonadaceae bacterium]|nr:hypothetical protein [Gemmatimonadaceae bacterium]